MLGASTPNWVIDVGWLSVSSANSADSIVLLDASAPNSAIGIGWWDASSTDSANNVVLLGTSISVGKIVWFYDAIPSCYIGKQLFGTIGSRFFCRDLISVIISCKMLTISCAYAFRLLMLRWQGRFNSLHKLLIDMIYIVTLANLCLSALENINSSISQGYFDVAKLVNTALQVFWSDMLIFFLCWRWSNFIVS